MTENHAEKERSPIQRLPPTVHCFVPQEPYKSTRPASPKVIEFVVNREVGIRLSDALAGNWANFEGRDDRSLFDGDRLQIIIRLQVGLSVCIHKRRVDHSLL